MPEIENIKKDFKEFIKTTKEQENTYPVPRLIELLRNKLRDLK